ncbi:MAG TPA: hypothetical protein VGL06_28160 [Pseudonocardiaceae bacterium]
MTTPSNGTEDPPQEDPPLPGARLAEELRLLLDALAERAQPWLNRLATEPDAEHSPTTCGWCPVCAGMAVLRGERPELAVRAAEHAAGLVAVLRSALAHPERAQPEPPRPAGSTDDRVEHITVRRRGNTEDGEC